MSDELVRRAKERIKTLENAHDLTVCGVTVERDVESISDDRDLLRELIAEIERLRALIPPIGWVQDGGKIVAEVYPKQGKASDK